MKLRFSAILIAAFIIMIGFSSCVRSYICQCTIVYTGQPGLPDTLIKEYPIKDTKKKAASTCEGNSGTYEDGGIKTTETCHLY